MPNQGFYIFTIYVVENTNLNDVFNWAYCYH